MTITNGSGVVVWGRNDVLIRPKEVKGFDWTTSVNPTFTVKYTYVSDGVPNTVTKPVSSRVIALPKPPTEAYSAANGQRSSFKEVITLG